MTRSSLALSRVGICRKPACQVSDDIGNRASRDRSAAAGRNVPVAEPDEPPGDASVRRIQAIAPGVDRQAHRTPGRRDRASSGLPCE